MPKKLNNSMFHYPNGQYVYMLCNLLGSEYIIYLDNKYLRFLLYDSIYFLFLFFGQTICVFLFGSHSIYISCARIGNVVDFMGKGTMKEE